LSGRENVYLCGAVLGLSRRELEACYRDIVSFSGVGEFIDQPLKTYSSGMYVRLAFALAMGVSPDILVVDEALAVGDTLFQAKCFLRFREFQRKGVTIILATHSLDLVTRLCNKACLLERGQMIAFDEPARVVDRYHRLILGHPGNRTGPLDSDAVYSGSMEKGMQEGSGGYCASGRRESRYGNGKVSIEHIGIYDKDKVQVNDLDQNGEYAFCFRVLFIEQVENPVFSYRIKDSRGNDLAGTNTLYHNIPAETFLPRESIIISFRQKIGLNPGEYYLSAGCAGFENGTYVVYDRRADAVSFKVIGRQPGKGLIALDAKITVAREQCVTSEKNR
jgi:teichoic acid transport system ATP-binding protein